MTPLPLAQEDCRYNKTDVLELAIALGHAQAFQMWLDWINGIRMGTLKDTIPLFKMEKELEAALKMYKESGVI
jgi:hypothetical protein